MSEDNTANTNIEETEKPVKATPKKEQEAKILNRKIHTPITTFVSLTLQHFECFT